MAAGAWPCRGGWRAGLTVRAYVARLEEGRRGVIAAALALTVFCAVCVRVIRICISRMGGQSTCARMGAPRVPHGAFPSCARPFACVGGPRRRLRPSAAAAAAHAQCRAASALLRDLLDAPTVLAACCGFDLCHKYVLYSYLHVHAPTYFRMGAHSNCAFPVWVPIRRMRFPYGRPFDVTRVGGRYAADFIGATSPVFEPPPASAAAAANAALARLFPAAAHNADIIVYVEVCATRW